jgi:cytoskeletal protein CcmA (bactofilin family)
MIKTLETLFKSAILAVGLAGAVAAPALANQYVGGDISVNLDTDEDVVFLAADVEATGRIGGDVSALAADVRIDAEVGGDVSIAAADIFIGGSVAGEVEAAGADISIMANVMGDVSLAGADITVSGMVGGELAAGGAIVTLEPTSVVNGSAEIAASEVYAEGQILGRLEIEAREVYLRGVFEGPIEIYARDVVIGPDAVITGPLVVRSPNEPTVAESAQVGDLEYRQESWDESRIDRPDIDLDFDVLPSFWALGALYSSAALILGLIIVLLFPRSMARMSERFRARPWVSGGLGLIVWATAWLMMLVLVVLLAITIVGVLLIPFVLAAIPILYFLSFVFGGVVIGDLIFNRSGGQAGFGLRILSLLAVLLIVAGLHVIPPVGWLVGLLVQFIGFGAWTLAIFDRQDRVQTLEGEAV